nr:traB domain-containing protein-like [Ipomoea batatas]GME05089.1 traB domain-containing protein-like [Ipomoea batatas]
MHRLIRTPLAFLNSSESTRFLSLVAPSLRRFSHLRSLAAVSLLPKPPSTQSLRHSRPPLCADAMDSHPLSASGIEDFVHVDGAGAGAGAVADSNFRSEGSEESVVADTAVEEATGGEVESQGYARKVLPEELSKSVVMLNCDSSAEGGACDVYLLGTAHVSSESCEEVRAAINFLKPQVVFLELCSSRIAILTPQNLKIPTMGEMVEMWKKNHNLFAILYSWFLAKVASKLEVFPGAEFRVAYEEAMKYGGKVILGDRPVQVTLRRTWARMPLWHKTKLVYSLMFQAVFLPSPEDLNRMLKEMDDVDMLTLVIQEMSKQFPTLMETLVHERDQYMASTLLRVAREHNSVLAVVGKGHLLGMQKYWQQPIEVKELLSLPAQKPAVSVKKILTTVGVAVAGAAILSGIYFSSKK